MIAAYLLAAFAVGWMFAHVTRKPAPPHGTLPQVWTEPEPDGTYRVCAAYRRIGPQYSGVVACVTGSPESIAVGAREAMQRCITERVGV